MSDKTIIVEGLGKKFHIGANQISQQQTLISNTRRLLTNPIQRVGRALRGQPIEHSEQIIWALRDVNFEVGQGEVIGIIGPNGAGKSTLLKVLSRITPPSEGRVRLRGNVASLLEVGTGFHPLLTGRENIYLNGTILGMNRREIDAKLDEIIDFSGVEKFLDTPVRHYSSGMRVRLGFSVAAHLEPEILLVDEVLAVGDLAFQRKCLGKMEEVSSAGRTVLFVSHHMESIMNLCPRTVLLDNGGLAMDGETRRVIERYQELSSQPYDGKSIPISERTDRNGSGRLRFTDVRLENEHEQPITSIRSGQVLRIVLDYEKRDDSVSNADFWVSIVDGYGRILTRPWMQISGDLIHQVSPTGTVVCHLPKLNLVPGEYTLDIGVRANGEKADSLKNVMRIHVVGSEYYPSMADDRHDIGLFFSDFSWE